MLRCDQIDETISYLEMVFDDKCRIPSADDLELVVQLIQAVALCVEGELQMSKFFVDGDSGPQLEIGNETVLSFLGSDEITITTSNPSTVTITLSELVKNKINNALVLGDNISLLNNDVGYITGISWGDIGGTLSDQTDLINILNNKFDTPTGTTSQYIRGDGSLSNFPTIPTAFTGLVDTPSDYTGAGKKVVHVKEDETGLDFSSVLYIDEVNKRIGINTATPDQPLTILRDDGNPLLRVVPATGTDGTKIIGYRGSSPYSSGVLEIGSTGLIFETNGGNFRFGTGQNGFGHSGGQVTISKDGGNPRLTFRDHPSYFRLNMNPAGDLSFNNDTEDVVVFNNSGAVVFNKYGAGTFVGTPAKMLAVTSNGNVIEEDLPTPIEQYFVEITESGNTGYGTKYRKDNPDNYGDIGDSAIDLGFSTDASSTRGATGQHSTVSGGWDNTASGTYSTVSGGGDNTASGIVSTISGGGSNTASGEFSTVSGGLGNTASGQRSTVGGGTSNTASGNQSVVSGGQSNTASGTYSTVSGGLDNTANSFASWFGGRYSTIFTGQTATSWVPTDILFNIGNGTSSALRSNALSLFKNGRLELPSYGDGTFTGTATKLLAVDADGKVIEEDLPTSESVDWDEITGDQSDISLGGFTNDVGFTTNTGTVTSVAISGSDGIEVDSGSPVTSSGTIVLGINASSLRSHINVEDGAQVNVKSDWNSVSGDSEILNKPTLVTEFTGLSDTPANYSGQGGKAVAVNSGGTALEFVEFPDTTPFNLVVDDGDEEVSNVNKINFVGATVTDDDDGEITVTVVETIRAWISPYDEDLEVEEYPGFVVTPEMTMVRAWVVCTEVPTGDDIEIDMVNRTDSNTTLASFTISANTNKSNVVTTFLDTVSEGDVIIFDCTQIGSSNAGGGLQLYLEIIKS